MWQAIDMAEAFSKAGYHKQIVNRLLEPFSHITVVVTGTQWSNFLTLGDHPDAEPHIQILAKRVREALDSAEVQILERGQWHLPFVTKDELREANHGPSQTPKYGWLKKLSVARCASTSYKTVDGFDMTFERAEQLYDKLFWARRRTYRRSSTTPKPVDSARGTKVGERVHSFWRNKHQAANLGPGWVQFRRTISGECL